MCERRPAVLERRIVRNVSRGVSDFVQIPAGAASLDCSPAKDEDSGDSSPTSIVGLVLSVMDQQAIVLRSARPILEEGLVYARYLDEAAEGFFRFMLGRRVADIVAAAYIQPDNDYSYQNVTFAEHDKVIVGMASSFTARQRRCFSDQPLKRAAGNRHLRMSVVTTLCAPLLRIVDTIADGDFYLQAIAVDKELRGEGVGSILIDYIEERAVVSGSVRLSLDVSAKNKGARRLYERRGMTVESEWPKLWFIPSLFVRMTKPL